MEDIVEYSFQDQNSPLTLLSIYLLLQQILKQIPDEEIIKKSKNKLQVRIYKVSLRQWMYDWMIGGVNLNHKVQCTFY